MSVLTPITHALAAVVATTHGALTSLGASPTSGVTWLLSIAAVVVVVRSALLPVVIHGVRQAHAAAHARPQLQALIQRYRNRTDAASMRAFLAERRRIAAEHRVSRWGWLPALAQLPIWWGLYHVIATVSAGSPVGALSAPLAASLGAATLLGVPLAQRGYLGHGLAHLAVAVTLAGSAALLSYLTQRYLVLPNTVVTEAPEAIARVQQLLPFISAIGLLVTAGFVPLALVAYWVCNQAWTLGQSAVVWRWFPTPGSPAADR